MYNDISKLKILIVEDEDFERNVLLNYINWAMLNIQVVGSARSGKEGLALCMQEKPDIVLTDVKMHGMDGLEMSQNIHSIYPDVKIIFLSSYDNFEYLQKALSLKAVDYLTKPLDKMKLLEVVKKAADMITDERLKNDFLTAQQSNYKKSNELAREYLVSKLLNGIELKENELSLFQILNMSWLHYFPNEINISIIVLKAPINPDTLHVLKSTLLNTGCRNEIVTISKNTYTLISVNNKEIDDFKVFLEQQLINEKVEKIIISSCEINEFNDLYKHYLELIKDNLLVLPNLSTGAEAFNAKGSQNHYKKDIINVVKDIIEREYSNQLTLRQIAQELHFTPNYLGRLFKSSTGESFNSYLLNIRIKHATDMLIFTDLSIQNISEKCGFENITYFYTRFKQVNEVTPYEYRKNEKQKN